VFACDAATVMGCLVVLVVVAVLVVLVIVLVVLVVVVLAVLVALAVQVVLVGFVGLVVLSDMIVEAVVHASTALLCGTGSSTTAAAAGEAEGVGSAIDIPSSISGMLMRRF